MTCRVNGGQGERARRRTTQKAAATNGKVALARRMFADQSHSIPEICIATSKKPNHPRNYQSFAHRIPKFTGYTSIFIFECKNWEKKVGKDEIIVFSKKIDVVHAQTGYFIAKSFTRDAEAQAEQDGRLKLLIATEELDTLSPLIANFHILCNTVIDSNANFTLRPGEIFKPRTYTHESAVRYRNEDLLLRTFNEGMQRRITDEVMRNVPDDLIGKGVYIYTKTQTLVFHPHELTIEGQECYRVDMTVTWETRIIRPPIVSKFDIKTRGRVITYDSGELPSVGNIQMSFIEIE